MASGCLLPSTSLVASSRRSGSATCHLVMLRIVSPRSTRTIPLRVPILAVGLLLASGSCFALPPAWAFGPIRTTWQGYRTRTESAPPCWANCYVNQQAVHPGRSRTARPILGARSCKHLPRQLITHCTATSPTKPPDSLIVKEADKARYLPLTKPLQPKALRYCKLLLPFNGNFTLFSMSPRLVGYGTARWKRKPEIKTEFLTPTSEKFSRFSRENLCNSIVGTLFAPCWHERGY